MVIQSFIIFTIVMFSGGVVFMYLEQGEARKYLSPQLEIASAKDGIVKHSNMSRKEVEEIFKMVEKAIQQNGVKEPYKWNYYESCFFVGSLLTTIGYGHIAPKTIYGQMFAVVYSFFGIPLTVLVIRKLSTRIIDTIVQIVRSAYGASNRAESIVTDAEEYNPDQRAIHNLAGYKTNRGTRTKRKSNRFMSADQRTKITCLIVLFLMVILFVTLSSIIRVISEGWTMQQSIYFWFTTLTTIGFGDFVPYDGRKPPTMIATVVYYTGTFYLMFGLALLTSLIQCISVIFEGRLPRVATEVSGKVKEHQIEMDSHSMDREEGTGPAPSESNRLKEIFAIQCEEEKSDVKNAVLYSSLRVLKLSIPERGVANQSESIDNNGGSMLDC